MKLPWLSKKRTKSKSIVEIDRGVLAMVKYKNSFAYARSLTRDLYPLEDPELRFYLFGLEYFPYGKNALNSLTFHRLTFLFPCLNSWRTSTWSNSYNVSFSLQTQFQYSKTNQGKTYSVMILGFGFRYQSGYNRIYD